MCGVPELSHPEEGRREEEACLCKWLHNKGDGRFHSCGKGKRVFFLFVFFIHLSIYLFTYLFVNQFVFILVVKERRNVIPQ